MAIIIKIIKITLASLIAALVCTGVIYAATTIGANISTGGTLTVGDNAIFNTASSTGIVKFPQINSDTGSISFGDDNIYTTGNIGIGTSSPYAKLSVVGEVVASYFTATSTIATSTFLGGLIAGSGGLVYDFSTGNVGIGTLIADNSLDVRNISGDASIAVESNDSDNVYLKLLEGANLEPINDYGGMIKYDGSSNSLEIGTFDDGVEYPAIYVPRGSYNVGIGTTTPPNIFTVTQSPVATTTIEFGDQYSSNSKVCHNTKNIAGANISFYFVGTTMVVENNRCN